MTPNSGGKSVTSGMLSGTFPDNPWPLYLRPFGEYWTQGRAKDLFYNPAQHKPFEPRPTMPADHDEVDLTEAYDARQDFRQVCRLFDERLGSELEIVHSKPTMKRSPSLASRVRREHACSRIESQFPVRRQHPSSSRYSILAGC